MMEVGIFRKELHTREMINNGMADQVGAYSWADTADGKEVVFEDSVSSIGFMTMVNQSGRLVELPVLRDWCNDFRPLSEI